MVLRETPSGFAIEVTVFSGRMELTAAKTSALAVRTPGAALATAVRAGARLLRTSLSLGDRARFLAVANPWACRRGSAQVAEDGPRVISAKDVSFTYPGADRPALDASAWTSSGEVIALVGENGAGKSTKKFDGGLRRAVRWSGKKINKGASGHCWPPRLFRPYAVFRGPGQGYRWRVARPRNTTPRVCSPGRTPPSCTCRAYPKLGDQQEHHDLRVTTL